MNVGQIYFTDIANGVGCRTAVFVSGCTHHCKGCFNEDLGVLHTRTDSSRRARGWQHR